MSDGLNAATKYIATHRPESLEYGRSTPTSTLLERGLADEVLLIVYPVLLGQGKCFFS